MFSSTYTHNKTVLFHKYEIQYTYRMSSIQYQFFKALLCLATVARLDLLWTRTTHTHTHTHQTHLRIKFFFHSSILHWFWICFLCVFSFSNCWNEKWTYHWMAQLSIRFYILFECFKSTSASEQQTVFWALVHTQHNCDFYCR